MGRYVFKLPDVGEGTAEAEIVKWHVAVGQTVAEDQLLVDIMTDKATVELTSPVKGVVLELNGALGEMAVVGAPLVAFDVEGDGNAAGAVAVASKPAPAAPAAPPPPKLETPASPAPAAAKPAAPPAPKAPPSKPAAVARAPGQQVLASPAVRHRALELGVKLQFVPGSGPAGRISQQDLDAYIQTGGASSPATGLSQRHGVEEIKVMGLRRKIAERMADAKRRIAHFSYIEEIDVTALEDLRKHLNDKYAGKREKLTMLPFLMRAVVKATPDFPQVNAHYDDEANIIHRHAPVHIGIATQTPGGLMVPVVRHAEARDLWESASEVSRLAKAARDGSAARDELSGSTITISSLGAMGGIVATPVINSPEVAIIGVNKLMERPMVKDGQVVIRKMMNLSSSFDHRVVDGWDAASFIQAIKALLENPATLFLE
jgi:2-oxoisovalerate dehydrogenase E2 component (dihydrolipoyl transacylase)